MPARDRIADAALIVAALLYGLATAAVRVADGTEPPPLLFTVDQVAGVVGCLALWLRRRRPVPLAVALVVASSVFELVVGAMLVALCTVAVHRPPRTAVAVFGLSLLSALGYVLLRGDPELPGPVMFLFGAALQGGVTAWGLAVQHRRRLAESLRERALQETRDGIAREIHDVLGHRLSLLSVHAGALSYRPDAAPADVARAAEVIRENAHRALQDLRDVVGVLRAPVGELPQPSFADVDDLVAESRRAGTPVALTHEVDATPPDLLGRTAYRIVQEGLTNARVHAPSAPVRVRVAGAPGAELLVEIVNGAGSVPAVPRGGPGRGLAGLAERAALAGGTLEHGPCDGGWRVAARLPWKR